MTVITVINVLNQEVFPEFKRIILNVKDQY